MSESYENFNIKKFWSSYKMIYTTKIINGKLVASVNGEVLGIIEVNINNPIIFQGRLYINVYKLLDDINNVRALFSVFKRRNIFISPKETTDKVFTVESAPKQTEEKTFNVVSAPKNTKEKAFNTMPFQKETKEKSFNAVTNPKEETEKVFNAIPPQKERMEKEFNVMLSPKEVKMKSFHVFSHAVKIAKKIGSNMFRYKSGSGTIFCSIYFCCGF